MIRLPYKFWRLFFKLAPVCPHPRAIGRENIPPRSEPTLFVFNHVGNHAEGLYFALAAPADPPIRFIIGLTVLSGDLFSRTRRDVREAVLSWDLKQKMGRRLLTRKLMDKFIDFLTRLLISQVSGFNFIPVYIHYPLSAEERLRRWSVNREALEACVDSFEKCIPVAVAPSGGYTHDNGEHLPIRTFVPTVAAMLRRRGQELKIVPGVVKERPVVSKDTFKLYAADGIVVYRLFRQLLDKIGIWRYRRPLLTVEFLPPVTCGEESATKAGKIAMVTNLQEMIYTALRKD